MAKIPKFTPEEVAEYKAKYPEENQANSDEMERMQQSPLLQTFSGVAENVMPAVGQAQHLGRSALQGGADSLTQYLNLLGLQKAFGNPEKPIRVPIEKKPNEYAHLAGAILNPADPLSKLKIGAKIAGQAPSFLKKVLGYGAEGATKGAVGSAAMGEQLEPGHENLSSNAGLGGITGALMSGAGAAVPAGVKGAIAAMGNKALQKVLGAHKEAPLLTRSPKEVAAMEEFLPKDVRFNIGEIANEDLLKKLYSAGLGKIPWSGVKKEERKALNAAVGKTEDVTKKLLGKTHPEQVPNVLRQDVARLQDRVKSNSNKLYDEAKEKMGNVKFHNFPFTSHKASEMLKKDRENFIHDLTAKDRDILGKFAKKGKDFEEETRNFTAAHKEWLNDLYKSTGKSYDFEDVKKARAHFSSEARKAYANKDYERAKVMNDFKKTLGDDIGKNLEKSGKKDAFDKWKQAEKYYAKDVAPIRHNKKIMDIINGITPETSIARNLLNSRAYKGLGKNYEYDNPILRMLPQKDKNLIGYSLMRSAMKNSDALSDIKQASPLGFSMRASTIPPEISKKILTPEMKKAFKEQSLLAKATAEGAKSAGIHQTGVQLAEGGVAAKFLKHPLKGLLASFTGKGAGRVLNSPELRKAYAQGLEKFAKGSEAERKLIEDVLGKFGKKFEGLPKKTEKAREKTKRAISYELARPNEENK